MTPHPLDAAIEELRAGLREWWDADDAMDTDYLASLPVGRFIFAAHAYDAAVVEWLVYFVARRALACWELSVDDPSPRMVVEALGQYLHDRVDLNWWSASVAARTPFGDCRSSETQSASNAVAEAARYLHQHSPYDAIYCISSADIAYDHVLTKDRYRDWLIDVAIPVALEKREMTELEQEAMRHVASDFAS